jgi:hypothetical protein
VTTPGRQSRMINRTITATMRARMAMVRVFMPPQHAAVRYRDGGSSASAHRARAAEATDPTSIA